MEAQSCHIRSVTNSLRSIPLTIMKIDNQEAHPSVGRRGATSPSIEDAPDCKRLRLGASTEGLLDQEGCDDCERMTCGERCQA